VFAPEHHAPFARFGRARLFPLPAPLPDARFQRRIVRPGQKPGQMLPGAFQVLFGVDPHRPTARLGFDLVADALRVEEIAETGRAALRGQMTDQAHD